MRVLVVGAAWTDSSEMGCVRGLQALGHEAEICDLRNHMGVPGPLQRFPMAHLVADFVLRATVREPYQLAQRPLLDRVAAYRPDLVLVVQLVWVLPETIAALRDRGVRCVGWFPDAFTSFGRGSFLLAPYDALFFQDPFIVDRLSTAFGVDNIHHLPQCCDPAFHRPLPLTPEEAAAYRADVATFGNFYPYRARLLEPLLDGSLQVKLYGSRPPRWLRHPAREYWAHKHLSGDEKSKAMLAARIALNTNHYAGIGDVNKRTFELAGIGAFQLTDDRAALSKYFEPGVEIAVFQGRADLREQVDYYLKRPEERAAMAERAQRRAHREHTFEARLRTLLQIIQKQQQN